MIKLERDFYNRPTLDVAKDLIGKVVLFDSFQGIITETEAYVGRDDPACHAARGMTERNKVMFGKAGVSYVYFIYGMYHCLNFVTEEEGFPAAVLIRGVYIPQLDYKKTNGPGKLCKVMNITREHSSVDITDNNNFYVADKGYDLKFDTTSRIGISKGKDLPWRFVVGKNELKKIVG
ncbi:MAG: 3-methyladenine DNA glycosylase [Alphaproteobacteria bacterium CG11_big_fil_rev_8_21_14_0_20_39_49]|nr:MAG: 3-methyladenine DNA glycosylase [Alphaproteobacteria bacterium CG11_big_fil_rev_8_21_14_0_20_39_49]